MFADRPDIPDDDLEQRFRAMLCAERIACLAFGALFGAIGMCALMLTALVKYFS